MQLDLHLQQLVTLALHQFAYRNAGCPCDHLSNFFSAHLGTQQLRNFVDALFIFACLGLL